MSSKRRKENATHRKCAEILSFVVNKCNEHPDQKGHGPVVGFGPDWGENSLTVYLNGDHTHVGDITEGGTFEELVDQLHDLLLNGRGLSWA